MSNRKDDTKDDTEFKSAVKAYVECDNEIKDLLSQKKQLADEKKQLEEFMIEYMTQNKHEEILISDGKLQLSLTKSKGALKKEYIQDRISKYTDTAKAITITEDIFEHRPITEKRQIKRCAKKKERKKKKKN
jgi:hypothetical protein